MSYKEIVSNRKAFHNYEILESYEAGLVLKGTEIKSLRNHGGNLNEAYVTIIKNELWLINSSIAPYRFGNINNHEENRQRKLLMHKKEIIKLTKFLSIKGFTLVPLAFILKNGFVKVKIGCAKGKTRGDKRQAIIDKEKKREIERTIKNYN